MPSTPALNEELLTGNTCFGCGLDNHEGLHIHIYRDGDRADRLIGRYVPRENHGGFPGIVHGGLQFTALDCMAAWIIFALRAPRQVIPLTKSASMRFMRPALVTDELVLTAQITRDAATLRDALLIHTEIKNVRDEVLSAAEFEYVMLPPDKFKKVVGLDALPNTYQRHFGLG